MGERCERVGRAQKDVLGTPTMCLAEKMHAYLTGTGAPRGWLLRGAGMLEIAGAARAAAGWGRVCTLGFVELSVLRGVSREWVD